METGMEWIAAAKIFTFFVLGVVFMVFEGAEGHKSYVCSGMYNATCELRIKDLTSHKSCIAQAEFPCNEYNIFHVPTSIVGQLPTRHNTCLVGGSYHFYRKCVYFTPCFSYFYSRTMKVHELTVKRADRPCGLHACLRHVLRLARWTGFFPVQGLGQTNADGTRFKIKCYYCCYYIATLIGQVVISSFTILFFFQTEVDLSTISNIIFYVTSFISAILLLKLSQQWPQLMAKATEIEQGLTELKLENKTVVQSTVIAYVVITVALVEHILCTNFNIRFVMNCLQEVGITSNVMENYVIHRMPYVLNYIPYSAFSAFVFEFICLQATFLWSFNDVMITCFSIYITAYFRNLNEVIAANAKKKKNGIPWSVLRVQYTKLVKLVKEIDVQISSFILLAFFTDLFYICLQLFNSLHRNNVSFKYCDEAQTSEALSSPYYLLYYLYSFIFMVLRTLMLSLFASNVHCAGLEPVYSIYDVPSSVYDVEVRRFQLQLHHTNVGLSGKFFYVTRSMILKVVGTIITYEIVLLQYSITPETYYNGTTVATIFENITGVYGQI